MIKAIEMAMLKLMFVATIAIMSINLAMGANYTVGAPNVFQYSTLDRHDVTEVSKADFDSCIATNPLQPPNSDGFTVIPLSSAGTRYFICGRHCRRGMKLQIDTLAAAASTPPPGTPSTPPPPVENILNL
ncbi:hypothetical protein DH2020_031402 [Rehmannia glutinosa]|uniref:Phytocyanin domain-containing protein n=1 Tax=Rehmannia glutinosa TaxID=99300 RepID=A0ABR0VL19_REHGL